MGNNKFINLVICWAVVIGATLSLVLFMPAIRAMSTDSADEMVATSNMTGIIGVEEATRSMPYWSYGIAPVVGLVYTVVVLRKKD